MRRFCLALAVLFGLAAGLTAAELRGVVRSVSGDAVTIRCDGAVSPRTGDEVRLGFDAPGVGFVPLDGVWKVSLIGPGGEVQAVPAGEGNGTPKTGHVAVIETEAAAPASPSEDRSHLPAIGRRPWIGVGIEITRAGSTGGALLRSVDPGGPAARAGIQAGDVIVAVAGEATPNSGALLKQLSSRQAGDVVTVELLRSANPVSADVTLELPPLDNPQVQRSIGLAYFFGQGVPKDQPAAVELFESAAAQGDQQASEILDHLRREAAGAQPAPRARQPASRPPTHPAEPQSSSRRTASQPWGVFMAGTEKGKRPGWFILESGIRPAVNMTGARVRDLPPDTWFRRNAAPPPEKVIESLRPLGGGWLLYMEVQTNWAHIGFGKDRVKLRCYDPRGKLMWKEESSNLMAQSADSSLRILTKKIAKKLRKRTGQPCLRP